MSTKRKCFVISPIGEKGSKTRKRSDDILQYIIRPICTDCGYETVRADEINEPGLITRKIINLLITADLVIADLTELNPNVFYELAIRHFTGKALIQFMDYKEKIPFDIHDTRTIHVNFQELGCVDECKKKLAEYIKNTENVDIVDNPILDIIPALFV